MNQTVDHTVTFFEKSVYGKTLIYPKCQNAIRLSKLIGSKTVSKQDLRQIEELGYTVELIALPS